MVVSICCLMNGATVWMKSEVNTSFYQSFQKYTKLRPRLLTLQHEVVRSHVENRFDVNCLNGSWGRRLETTRCGIFAALVHDNNIFLICVWISPWMCFSIMWYSSSLIKSLILLLAIVIITSELLLLLACLSFDAVSASDRQCAHAVQLQPNHVWRQRWSRSDTSWYAALILKRSFFKCVQWRW